MFAAHGGGEVNRPFWQQFVEFTTVAARVHHAEHPGKGRQFSGQIIPCPACRQIPGDDDLRAPQPLVELQFRGDDLTDVLQPRQGRLSGGGENQAYAVVRRQLTHGLDAGQQQIGRQHLDFVENHDAVGDVVEFAAAAGTAGMERLEELDAGGYYDRRVPILGGQATLLRFLVGIEAGMVLDHVVRAEKTAQHVGGLLDDRRIGDHVDDALMAVGQGVPQGEGGTGKGFAAARGNRQ